MSNSPEQKHNKVPTDLEKLDLLRKDEKEACEESFEQFVRSAWHILEPATELLWNPHLSYLCDEIQDSLTRVGNNQKRINHLCVNVPPSSLKTMLFTRMANAWAWIHWPWMRFITASHTQSLAEEHAMDTKMIIESAWYQGHWKANFRILKEQNAKSFYRTNFRGQRQVTSVTSTTLGRHCHIFICDDLLDPKKAVSEADLAAADLFWRRTAQSRFINSKIGVFWVIQQRLSPLDTTGRILEREAKHYKHICLPAEDRQWISPPEARAFYVKTDPDRPAILFPSKFPWEELDRFKHILDSVGYASQFLQRPSPEEGLIFKRQNWRFWVPAGFVLPPVRIDIGSESFYCENVELPLSFDSMACSWDFTFNDKKTSDYVSGHVVAQKSCNYYFLDEFRKKIDFHGSKVALTEMKKKWPSATTIYVEAKANGDAIMSEVEKWTEGIERVGATKGESPYTRAMAVSPLHRSGNFILPHPHIYPWVNDFMEEWAAYNKGEHDDRVCSGCQAIYKMRQSNPVIPGFRMKLQSYKIDWRNLDKDTQLYISQYVGPHLDSSIIMALWSTRTGRLVVFDELTMTETQPEFIKPAIQTKILRVTGGVITNLSRFQWYGDSSMFARSRSSAALRSLVQVDSVSEVYFRFGISLMDNISYNEGGATLLLQRMVVGGAVLIDERAAETSRQVSAWQYEGDVPAPGYGCARALCNVVSILYESARLEAEKKPKELKPYSDTRGKILEELDKHGNEADIDQRIRAITNNGRGRGQSSRDRVNPEDRWQV
jgi:predicted phage terminase large subunit-like protein